jgi:hypothetical protein
VARRSVRFPSDSGMPHIRPAQQRKRSHEKVLSIRPRACSCTCFHDAGSRRDQRECGGKASSPSSSPPHPSSSSSSPHPPSPQEGHAQEVLSVSSRQQEDRPLFRQEPVFFWFLPTPAAASRPVTTTIQRIAGQRIAGQRRASRRSRDQPSGLDRCRSTYPTGPRAGFQRRLSDAGPIGA